MLSPYRNMRWSACEQAWELMMGSHVLASIPGHQSIEDGHRAWAEMMEGLEPGMRDYLDVTTRGSQRAVDDAANGGNGTSARVSRNIIGFRPQ